MCFAATTGLPLYCTPAEVDGAYKQREAALEAYRQEQGAEAKRGSRRKTASAVAVPAKH